MLPPPAFFHFSLPPPLALVASEVKGGCQFSNFQDDFVFVLELLDGFCYLGAFELFSDFALEFSG
jgi:hypothetical protein